MRAASLVGALDYTDHEEALGTWLGCLSRGTTDLDFSGWLAVWWLLAGRTAQARGAAERSAVPLSDRFANRLVSEEEFVIEALYQRKGAQLQLWSALAAHRAGASWIGHLAEAAGRRSRVPATFEETLIPHLPTKMAQLLGGLLELSLRSATLAEHWAMQRDDPGTLLDRLTSRLHVTDWLSATTASSTGKWSTDTMRADDPVPVLECRHRGRAVARGELAEMALVAAATGAEFVMAHAMSARGEWDIGDDLSAGMADPVVPLRPTEVTAGRIVGIDLVRERQVTMEHSSISRVGWAVVSTT